LDDTRRRVLIVDDDADFITATRAVLAASGYLVEECTRARQALNRVHEFKPDLIILDVMMETGTAGFHVSYQVRNDPHHASVPILMVTAIHQSTPLRFSPATDGEYLPVEELLDKPVPADLLIEKVRRLLGEAGGDGRHVRQRG
jgi:CheY-like chemotaxis protein